MNDEERFKWVAEHVICITMGVFRAEMSWINDKGYTDSIYVERNLPIGEETDVELLRVLVDKASIQE